MQVEELLLDTLEELIDEDLKTFQFFCTIKNLDSCKPFPKARLEKASRTVTVSKLTEAYSEELAVSLTVEILKKMYKNNLAEDLKNKYAAAPSTSSSAQSPPTAAAAAPGAPGASMMAQQGAVIFAPTLTSGTTGSWNVTIHQPKNN
ncbi:uncharacterized protein si:ch211-114l13.9 [Amphiprion ocellaris]|uniref:uncharacterized protein si:ch211-114l13.9 n=1 Tax=Amphiprion ocellaris TaxID=80972 RepID=UPI001649CC9A|nr:uncharacterized protein si:ch211-114l13.9 [Amphiprion ocellaris]